MNDKNQDLNFFPRGAVAFFAVMTAFFAAVWLSMYAVLLHHR
jgi:hypothetical protein